MRTTLNWTGRTRIPYRSVPLAIEEIDTGAGMSELQLSGTLGLPDLPDCQLVLEAYRDTQRYRATLPLSASPMAVSITFPMFAAASAVLCDIKLVSTSEPGKILASALGVKPVASGSDPALRSLLPVDKDDALGETLWRLQLAGDQPILLVNSRLADWKAFVRRPDVFSLILPEVTRGIAAWLREQAAGEEDLGPVAIKWKAFFESDLSCPIPAVEADDEASWDDWVLDVTQKFAARHRFATEWMKGVEPGE